MIIASTLCGWDWIAGLAIVCSIITALSLWRGAPGAAWRGLGFVVLLGILINPQWVQQIKQPLPDIALIVVDQSQSMQTGDRAKLAIQAATALHAGGVTTRIIDVPATGGGTALFTAINNALIGIPPAQLAGVIAITDGEVTDIPAKLSFNAPFSVLIPAADNQTDRELRLLQTPSFGLVGHSVTLSLEVLDHGVHDNATLAPVTVTEDGAIIWQQNAVVGQPINVTVPVRHAGPAVIAAAVAPLPNEVSQINNQDAFTLNGIRTRLNVLLLTGSPNQGVRAWRELLLSDPSINLVHFTILRAPGEIMEDDPQENAMVPFPVAQLFTEDLAKFNLIILDRFDPTGLLTAQDLSNMAAYVQNGGTLLTALGPEFSTPDSLALTPLNSVLPATPAAAGTMIGKFSPEVTPLGARHPVTAPFANMALSPWYRMQAASVSHGDVLMTGAHNMPLLLLAKAGQGRVAMLLSDQFWLWTRGGDNAGPALPLLRRVVHWLLRDPALQAEALDARIDNGQLIVTRQTVSATTPTAATITNPEGTARIVALHAAAPGRYTASVPATAPGVWKISEDNFTVFASQAVRDKTEYHDLAATDRLLRPVARNIIWLGQTPTPKLEPLLRRRHASEVTGAQDVAIVPPFLFMLAAIGLLLAAWWRERG